MRIRITQVVLFLLACGELLRAWLFLAQQPLAYALIDRPLIDPVISRQYGLFLVPVALFYVLLALDPVRHARLIWVAVAQRAVEGLLAINDLATGALSAQTALVTLAFEVAIIGVLVGLTRRSGSMWPAPEPDRRLRLMRRILLGFGYLFLFWSIASIIILQLGSWLLSYPVNDAYTTKQQGVTFLVLSLSSLFAARHVVQYRLFIWVPVASQLCGIFNAVYEAVVGTIPLTGAIIQWSIQAIIIGVLLRWYPWPARFPAHDATARAAVGPTPP